jgi:phage protein D
MDDKPQSKLASRIYLKLNGSDASEDVLDDIIRVEVDDRLSLPAMFTINLQDDDGKWIDEDALSLGTVVEISADNGSEKSKVAQGEITSIEPRISRVEGKTLVLRGYDKSHRLHRGKKTASYLQMKDSDIAAKIADNAGLPSQIDSTMQVHDYVLQDNKTDWEFLTARAKRIGYSMYVRDGRLHFVKTPAEGGATPTLVWGEDLTEFDASISTAHQISSVIVQGWDPSKQEKIEGKATIASGLPQIPESTDGGTAAREAFGITAEEVVISKPVSTKAEADALAQSLCNEIGRGYIKVEGIAEGNPRINAGGTVKLEGVGRRFSGTYRVNHALHRYNVSGYTTAFTVGGHHAGTITEILSGREYERPVNSPVLGIVTNNSDPDNLGRVKVKIPTLSEDEDANWARLVLPASGNERGLQWLPEINDEVLVLFEYEDINRPLVIGGLWSQKNPPPVSSDECVDSQGHVKKRQIVSRQGTKIVWSDDDGDRYMHISNSDEDLYLKLSDTDSKLEIVSRGEVSVQSTGKTTIQASEVNVKADSNVKITAGSNINLEASGKVTIKGAMIELN